MRPQRAGLALCCMLMLATSVRAQRPDQPEAATGFEPRSAVTASRAMIVTANPHASAAGLAMLREGGSAVDAAIAAVLVLNVVEPQSAGLGGGALALHYDPVAARIEAWDGRETAPQAASEDLFLGPDGLPVGFQDAAIGGRAVGVPGLARLLGDLHQGHGRLAWARLFEPAIALAEQGFAISPRLHALIARDRHLARDPQARALFHDPDGRPLAIGARLRNPALAALLRSLASEGAEAFYRAPMASKLVEAVQAEPNPGRLALGDLAAYRVLRREPLCAPYRGWRVCGMPPPSAGGGTVLAILGLLQRFPLSGIDPDSAFSRHLFAEAGRLAFADRDAWYGDPEAMTLSPARLLDPDYLAQRSGLIRLHARPGPAEPGQPAAAVLPTAAMALEQPSTTHLSVVDEQGQALALTASIEDAFGSRRMVQGLLLNNQLTDFSFAPTDGRGLHPNRVGPGRRPRSSMAPTLVFAPDGRLHAVLGSPGGSPIINYVAAAVVGLIDWQMEPRTLLARPHVGNRNAATEVEDNPEGRMLAERLRLFGHEPVLRELTSGIGLIVRSPAGWTGAADPRREGRAAGF